MRVLLGVTGGVAAYKAAEIVRSLQKNAVEVQVAMTRSAQDFVQPLTFAALTGKPVFTSLWQQAEATREAVDDAFAIEHIAVAQQIDALVVAPATANTLAKFAHGLADDFLSTLYLATKAPVLVAPAMNVNMWQHAATRSNLSVLESRGVQVIAPEDGYLACGMVGGGRLAEVESITGAVLNALMRKTDLAGEHILITAGGTREAIDPVRFLGNRSSGKMGHALAEAALQRGAHVTLVTASSLPVSAGCTVHRVRTAEEMRSVVLAALPSMTMVIKAAAVADFRPRIVAEQKLHRTGPMTLELEPTEDIVAEVVQRKAPGTLVIAFAAESEQLEERAYAKMLRKGVDAIVANDISSAELGFDSERNAGLFLAREHRVELQPSSKRVMADRILDEAHQLRRALVAI